MVPSTASSEPMNRSTSSGVNGVAFTRTVERELAPAVRVVATRMCCDGSSTPISASALRAVLVYRVVRLGFLSKFASPNCAARMPSSLRCSRLSTMVSLV